MSASTPDEKKVWRPFVFNISLIVILFIIGVFIGLFVRNKHLIEESIKMRARSHFQSIVLTRRWNASYGGVFVEKKEGVHSNPYLENPDITTVEGKTYTKKNPALMTREIAEYAAKDGQFLFHITSLKPLNPNNAPDEFERTALSAFEQGEREIFAREKMQGRTYFRYMAPLYVEKSCLACHQKQDYKVGDVRGGISVSFDIANIERELNVNMYIILSLGIVTILILVAIIYFLVLDLGKKLSVARELLKKNQMQLVQSEKMAGLGTLVAGVAHEINNPVNFVHLSAASLATDLAAFKRFIFELAGSDADEEVTAIFNEKFARFEHCLQDINDGGKRIKTIVSDLRTFSRLDEADQKHVNVIESLQSTLRLVDTQYRKTVNIICDFQAQPELECWPAQLNQVFMNILTNACQAMNQKQQQTGDQTPGTLTIRSVIDGEYLKISFQDTGCGMTPEVQNKVFEPFFTTKPVGEGVGMGMSISFSIIEKHRGRIEIASTPGKGSTFSVFLPIKSEIK